MKRPRFTLQEKELLTALWPTAKTKQEIVDAFPNRNYRVLQNIANRLGLKAYQRSRRGELTWLLSDDLQACYWLGFILADGHISKTDHLQVMLNCRDKRHLDVLAQSLGTTVRYAYTNPDKDYARGANFHTDKSVRELVKLAIMHKSIGSRVLARIGYDERNLPKTYNSPHREALDAFTDNQFKAFFIGFFDGDGYIGPTTSRIENNQGMLHFYEYCIYRNAISWVGVSQNPKTVAAVISKSKMREHRRWILDNRLTVMERKWSKIDDPI